MARQKTAPRAVSDKLLPRTANVLTLLFGAICRYLRKLCPDPLVGPCRAFTFAHGPHDRHRRQWTSRPNGVARPAGQQHRQCVHRGV